MSHRPTVSVTCPICLKARLIGKAAKEYRERHGTFSAKCIKDRMLLTRRADRLPRLPHPAVNWDGVALIDRRARVPVTCPKCRSTRHAHPGSVAAKLRAGGFSGLCATCCPKAKKREWTRLGHGRKLDPAKGYVWLSLDPLTPKDRALADGMRGKRTFILEHRLVMARVLGRPLLSNELVDHMDGIKTNNDPSNLRLYVRGKNQPGETSGYGTYYDEWQRALAKLREHGLA